MKRLTVTLVLAVLSSSSAILAQDLFLKAGPSFTTTGDSWGHFNEFGIGIHKSEKSRFQFSVAQTYHNLVFDYKIQDPTATLFPSDLVFDSDIRRQTTGIELHSDYSYNVINQSKFKLTTSIGVFARRQVVDWKNFLIFTPLTTGAPVDLLIFDHKPGEYITYDVGVRLQVQTQFKISPKEWYLTADASGQIDSNRELLYNFPIGISKTLIDKK